MKNIHLRLDTSYSILNIGTFTLKFIKLKMHKEKHHIWGSYSAVAELALAQMLIHDWSKGIGLTVFCLFLSSSFVWSVMLCIEKLLACCSSFFPACNGPKHITYHEKESTMMQLWPHSSDFRHFFPTKVVPGRMKCREMHQPSSGLWFTHLINDVISKDWYWHWAGKWCFHRFTVGIDPLQTCKSLCRSVLHYAVAGVT